MSFLKNWLPGLILAIPLLCSPWIVETLQAKGRLNAINIDSGRWAGEHQLFLKLGRNPAGDKDYFSSDDLVLSINGEPEHEFRLVPIGPQNPFQIRILLPFGNFPEFQSSEILESISNGFFQKTSFIDLDFWKSEEEIIKFSELESLPKTSFSSETIQDSELSQWLVEAIRDFETGKNLKVMVRFLPTLKAGEEQENLFSSQQKDQLRRKQILPWFITSSVPPETITRELESLGGGVIQLVPGEVTESIDTLRNELLSHYVLTHQPGWIGNVPYLLELKFRNEQKPVIRQVIDSGKIMQQFSEPYSLYIILPIFILSLLLLVLLWWLRRPRLSTTGRTGFVILNPEENFRFLEMPEGVKNLEFLNNLQTNRELRLSSNLNRVNLIKQQKTFLIEDKNYKNALLINRRRSHRTLLCNNDVLDVGELVLLYKNPEAPPQQNRKAPVRDKVTPVPGDKPKGPLRRDTPVLNFNGSRQEFPLVRNITTIGSSSVNDMVLNSEEVAPKHARISRIGGRWQLQNLSMQEFTMLNGRRIEQRFLRDGDEITIGDAVCRFKLVRTQPASKTQKKKEPVTKAG